MTDAAIYAMFNNLKTIVTATAVRQQRAEALAVVAIQLCGGPKHTAECAFVKAVTEVERKVKAGEMAAPTEESPVQVDDCNCAFAVVSQMLADVARDHEQLAAAQKQIVKPVSGIIQ